MSNVNTEYIRPIVFLIIVNVLLNVGITLGWYYYDSQQTIIGNEPFFTTTFENSGFGTVLIIPIINTLSFLFYPYPFNFIMGFVNGLINILLSLYVALALYEGLNPLN